MSKKKTEKQSIIDKQYIIHRLWAK